MFETAIAAVSTVGFPIVIVFVGICALKYMFDIMTQRLDEESRRHSEEMEKITVALNNNTIALTTLAERIGRE